MCQHKWTRPVEIVGGLQENPGWESLGGTKFTKREFCPKCNSIKKTIFYGSQRNHGEKDHSYIYSLDQ